MHHIFEEQPLELGCLSPLSTDVAYASTAVERHDDVSRRIRFLASTMYNMLVRHLSSKALAVFSQARSPTCLVCEKVHS